MNCWNQQCDTSRVNISQLHSLSSNSPLPVAGRHKQAHLLSTTIPLIFRPHTLQTRR